MAEGTLWQNSKGEIIQCEDGNIAFAEECPCGGVYLPAVIFNCNNESNACEYYSPSDIMIMVRLNSGKITKVYKVDSSTGARTDITAEVKDGTVFSYVSPFDSIDKKTGLGKEGPLGERASSTHTGVVFPPPVSKSILSVYYSNTRLACFYEYRNEAWLVPLSWYHYTFTTDYTIDYYSFTKHDSWEGASTQSKAYVLELSREYRPWPNNPNESSTVIVLHTSQADTIEDKVSTLCSNEYNGTFFTKEISSSVGITSGYTPYKIEFDGSSYKCCNGLTGSIPVPPEFNTYTSINTTLDVEADYRLPTKDCGLSYPMSNGADGCKYPSNPAITKTLSWEINWAPARSGSSGQVLYVNGEATKSFKDVTHWSEGEEGCYTEGSFTCVATASGDATLTLEMTITVSASDSKASCTYEEDGSELSLYPIKIEESDNDE